MLNFIKLELIALSTIFQGWFHYIIPEYPAAGSFLSFAALIVFFVYLFKSGIQQAFKICAVIMGIGIFCLLTLHYVIKLFFHH